MIVIGTRGSALALWQAHHVEALLNTIGQECRIQIIKTQGDVVRHVSLEKLEGKGFFTKELEDALLNGSIDLAVHSLKDLPTTSPPGLRIAAIPDREDPSEILLIHPDAYDDTAPELPLKHGATLGTSSNRRRALVLSKRPDLNVVALRGNVPTRVEKLKQGGYDAILLAYAGIKRLELELFPLMTRVLNPEVWIPAPGQGALALQVRAEDTATGAVVERLHDSRVEAVVGAERRLLALLHGGCHLPLGAYARWEGQDNAQKIRLQALLGEELSGTGRIQQWPVAQVDITGASAEEVAQRALEALLVQKSRWHAPVESQPEPTRNASRPLARKTVVVTRAADRADALVERLEALGAQVIRFPTVRQEAALDPETLREATGRLRPGDWVLFASAVGVSYLIEGLAAVGLELPAGIRLGAIGPATARALEKRGLSVSLMPDEAIAEAFVSAFVKTFLAGDARPRVLLPSAQEGRTVISEGLRAQGCEVERVTVYRTVLPEGGVVPDLSGSPIDFVLFMSPSAAENFSKLTPWPETAEGVTIGPTTSAAVHALGLPVHREASDPSVDGIIETLLKHRDAPDA